MTKPAGLTAALAGARAALAMTKLSLAMHPHACSDCRKGGPCASKRSLLSNRDRLAADVARLEA